MAGKKRKSKDNNNSGKKKKVEAEPSTQQQEAQPIFFPELEDQSEPIPTSFKYSLTKEDTMQVLCVDLGSSFTKMATLSAYLSESGKLEIVGNPTQFRSSNESTYTSSNLYYSNGEYSLSKNRNWSNPNCPVISLHTIKKLLTIKHQDIVVVDGVTFRVSSIMYQLIKCILQDACLDTNLVLFKFVFFTIPTGSSENAKIIYRNCIKKAVEEVFPRAKLAINQILIIEEYRLLSLCRDSNHIRQLTNLTNLLLTDVGNLTVDSTCLERDSPSGKFRITHSSAEVAGTSLIHKAIEKNGIDPKKLLGSMFSSNCETIDIQDINTSTNLKSLESDLKKACKTILNSVFEICFERDLKDVMLFGAITGQPYFRKLFKELLSMKEFENFFQNKRYIKDKTKITPIEVHIYPCQRTALIKGIEILMKKSFGKEVTLSHSNQLSSYQEIPGLLLEKKGKKKYSYLKYISTTPSNHLFMNQEQEFELFILKFRHTTDLSSLKEVNKSNFDKIGLFECERHYTFLIEFCPEILELKEDFEVLVNLKSNQENSITVIYQEGNSKMKKEFPFNRTHCYEKVSIDEIENILVKDESDAQVNWYGNSFRTTLKIDLNQGIKYEPKDESSSSTKKKRKQKKK